jgi:hypothetical protein
MQPHSRSRKSFALTVGRILSGVGAALIRDSVDATAQPFAKEFRSYGTEHTPRVGADLIRDSVDVISQPRERVSLLRYRTYAACRSGSYPR